MKKPDDVDQQVWDDWIISRKSRVVTVAALNRLMREATKVNFTLNEAITFCAEQSLFSAKAAWLIQDRQDDLIQPPKRAYKTKDEITQEKNMEAHEQMARKIDSWIGTETTLDGQCSEQQIHRLFHD